MLHNLTEQLTKVLAIRAQQKSLDSLVHVVLDNCIALAYLPAAQGGICAIINTPCCTQINTFPQVKLETTKHHKFAKSLKGHSKATTGIPIWLKLKFLTFFNWCPDGLRAILRSVLQIVIIIIVLTGSIFLIVKLLICCITKYPNSTVKIQIMVFQRLEMLNQAFPIEE